MIPARIDDDRVSAGERRVFGLLQSDPATTDWTVLHSLGIARRPTGPYGEIDFVVIIPGEGVICLEVKGGRLSCEAGVWRTMDRHGNVAALKKSPFLQARDSMFALRNAIVRHFGEAALETRCPIGCAVVFPDVPCPPLTPEFERSDAIDSDDLRGPISRSIMRVARRRLREFQPRHGEPLPTTTEARAIRNFLRPDFELIVAKGVSVGRTEEKLLRLTEEQYARLDELEANPRCLFEGAAGTGKTLLALEYARRASDNGLKIALLSTAERCCAGAAAQHCTTGSAAACPRSPWEGPARGATRPPRGWRRPARGRGLWAHGAKRGNATILRGFCVWSGSA